MNPMEAQKEEISKGAFDTVIDAVKEYKLRSVGCVWAFGIGASMLYNWTRPLPPSVKVIHARLYAQALTLSALVASAGVEMAFPNEVPEEDPNAYTPSARRHQ
ncbi:hypothetical protein CYMTET_10107 [Cymbomonas tetramitiformis]|uniref:HIG1 domain-containing protein n=1 Tax=Cymbomonas tetramitiformis TaxID=36881 RepID=A0AAE0GQ40_9CHLO|nr:hypothetical protein CYMTET_10107 [Cymbomonas tetramitiformis]